MIELICEQSRPDRYGWGLVAVVVTPSAVADWCYRFRTDDAIRAMWRLAGELMDVTEGRKHWVTPVGNALELTWEVWGPLRSRQVVIPTAEHAVMVRLLAVSEAAL